MKMIFTCTEAWGTRFSAEAMAVAAAFIVSKVLSTPLISPPFNLLILLFDPKKKNYDLIFNRINYFVIVLQSNLANKTCVKRERKLNPGNERENQRNQKRFESMKVINTDS